MNYTQPQYCPEVITLLIKVGKTLIYKKIKNTVFSLNPLASCLLLALLASGCATTSYQSAQTDNTPAVAASDSADTDAATVLNSDDAQFEINPEVYADTRANAWDRLRANMKLEESEDHPRLLGELKWYAEHGEYMNRVFDRAEPFLHYILNEAEARDLPAELALLPIVESAFQPFAYSHGRAAGIWQFIPGTGKLYGLKQNWWYDGRRDVYASTRAALTYLENLNKEFDGDWLLALAAYNSGEGTVRRAVARNKMRNKPTDFWNLDLPRETEAYVPKLLALKRLISQPEHYGMALPCIEDVPHFERVDVGSQIDLAMAADLADMDIAELYRLNPGYNRWATDPDGPHHLLIPVNKAEYFREQLANLPPEDRIQWKRHQVGRGETLSHVADRYVVSVANIKSINKLHSNTLRAGQYLLIPVASRNLSDYSLSASQRKLATQNTSHQGTRVTHVVQQGDTFWNISRKYNVNTRQIAQWNGMATRDTLAAGQQLVIWTQGSNNAAPQQTRLGGEAIRSISYRVRNGDSLYRIAQKFNVAVNDLRRWNVIRSEHLRPGQVLKLYVDITAQTGEG